MSKFRVGGSDFFNSGARDVYGVDDQERYALMFLGSLDSDNPTLDSRLSIASLKAVVSRPDLGAYCDLIEPGLSTDMSVWAFEQMRAHTAGRQ